MIFSLSKKKYINKTDIHLFCMHNKQIERFNHHFQKVYTYNLYYNRFLTPILIPLNKPN